MNPNRKADLDNLRRAREWNYQRMESFRKFRRDVVRQLAGAHYSDSDRAFAPVNMLKLAYSIHRRQMIAADPHVLVTTKVKALRPQADTIERVMNQLIKEIHLRHTLKQWISEAWISMGVAVMGVGLNATGDYGEGAGTPFVEVVSLDDWFQDMYAKSWERINFCGHTYRLPYETVMERTDIYSRKALNKLTPTDYTPHNKTGESNTKSIEAGSDSFPDQLVEMVELVDFWVPGENLLVTLAADEGVDTALKVVEWEGPPNGPYYRLVFEELPDSTMGLSPAMGLYDAHEFTNVLFCKLQNQALKQKTVLGVQAAATADAERVVEAEDGEIIKMLNPQALNDKRMGGIDQGTQALAIQMRSLFSYLAGNLDSLGGLSASADTARGEQIIGQSSGMTMDDMRDAVTEGVRNIVRDLAWYRWTDPFRRDYVSKPVPHLPGRSYTEEFGPTTRRGNYWNFEFDIEPYSVQHLTPSSRLSALMQVLTQIVIPLRADLAQSGQNVNATNILTTVEKLTGLSELEEWISATPTLSPDNMQPSMPQGPGEMGGMRPNTTRTYVRKTVPGRSQRGTDYALMQTLMGGGVQGAEAAAARSAG